MSNLMTDLFSSVPNVSLDNAASKNTTDFKPDPKKSATGVFKAIIRFLPNPSDPVNKSVIKKNVVRLTNPTTNESRYVDCPSTVGKPDPIVDTFFKLRNSDNAVKREQSSLFSRKQRCTSLIQVLSCETDPTLNNKILVWTYGIKVYNKIVNEMTSPIAGVAPKNPFDLINGRVFIVSTKMVSGYPNYDDCQFVDTDATTRAFRIGVTKADGSMEYMPITADFISNEKGRAAVTDFLVTNAPDTSSYEYHDWDEDTSNFVANIINMYLSNQVLSTPQAAAALSKTVESHQAPVVGSPVSSAPSANDLAAIMNGVAPSAPTAAPTPGLQFGLNSVPGSQPSDEGFNANALGVSGIGDILNGGVNTPPQQSAPSASLDDLLSQTFF